MNAQWQYVVLLISSLYCCGISSTTVTMSVEQTNVHYGLVTNTSSTSDNNQMDKIHEGKTSTKNSSALSDKMSRSINISGDSFMLDGQPFRIVSGSLHYFRVPAVYWRDRLRKLRQAGLNAVSTYVEWSFHEPEERQYNFEGDRDIVKFVRLAAEEGLLVLLRPGPYICAERDLGGFPYWLLGKYRRIKLRTTNRDFMRESKIWLKKLFGLMSPLLYGNGGPIILVQVENEYGSYGKDKTYMAELRDVLAGHVGTAAILYTTDGRWWTYYSAGSVPDTLTTIDFGSEEDPEDAFKKFREYMPTGPLMNSEFYPGWLTHWGEKFNVVGTNNVTKCLRKMLDLGASVNFYMFFGGSNFEFTSGANYDVGYQPDITSYDYDAPLSEAGDPTIKYFAIRQVLEEYYPETKNLPLPVVAKKKAYGKVSMRAQTLLLSPAGRELLGKKYNTVYGTQLPTFEALRQRSGFVLYETILTSDNFTQLNSTHLLYVTSPRDRIYVFVEGKLQGIISRMHKIYDLPISIQSNNKLSLLVENQGRINFGKRIHDFKGILAGVYMDGKILNETWTITGYPLENIKLDNTTSFSEKGTLVNGPTMYEGSFVITDETPLDTFVDSTGWGKGYIWINGHNLGRYWREEGPQVTLYVPAPWLNASPQQNIIHILELEKAPSDLNISFLDYPILDSVPRRQTLTSKL